jgi:oligosaccharide repeat unit polymerase
MTDQTVALSLALAVLALTVMMQWLSAGLPNVVVFHNMAWTVALVCFGSGWITFSSVPASAWVLIAGSILAFNVGALLPAVAARGRRAGSMIERTRVAGATIVLPCLFLIGFLFYLRAVSSQVGLEALISDPQSVRAAQGSAAFVTAFPLYGRLLYFLGPLVLVLYANPALSGIRASRLVRFTVLGTTVAALALSESRTLLFVVFGWQAALMFLRPRAKLSLAQRRRWIFRLVLLAILALGAFQLIASVTGKTYSADRRFQPHVHGPLKNSPATGFVLYVAGGIPAFGNLQRATPESGWSNGTSTLSTLFKAVPLAHVPPEVSPNTNIPFPFNVYTWLETFYRDFGPAGVIAFPFGMGLMIALVCARATRTSRHLLIASLLLGLSLWAPFANPYRESFAWEYLIILVMLRFEPVSNAGRVSETNAPRDTLSL